MSGSFSAAIVTVGTEITAGLRLDTNTRDIAEALLRAGYVTRETVSLPDDVDLVAAALERLIGAYALVVVTGGLGPTHDDITREAASRALSRSLHEDPRVRMTLAPWVERHTSEDARAQVLTQALILDGARVLPATVGTAPGQVVETEAGHRLVLLPGPPFEMRPMLDLLLAEETAESAVPLELGCTGLPESEVQLAAQRALEGMSGVELTILASPADVRVVLLDAGAGADGLARAGAAVRDELGAACYSDDGRTLAQIVVESAASAGVRLATAESCTGGMVAAALTSVAGSSAVFLGGVVAYANEVKIAELDVPPGLLAQFGAVSEETARAMAEGARSRLGADIAVAVTGIAGPDGGTADKPVGTVWFAVADESGSRAILKKLVGDRAGIRTRATMSALDLFRTTIARRT